MEKVKIRGMFFSGYMYPIVLLLYFALFILYTHKYDYVAGFIFFALIFRWSCFLLAMIIIKPRPTQTNLISDYATLFLMFSAYLIPDIFHFMQKTGNSLGLFLA